MSLLDVDHWKGNVITRITELLRRVEDLERPAAGSWARATQSDAQSIANNSAAKVEYDEEQFDERGEYDPGTNHRFTAITAGIYAVHAALMFAATDTFAGAEYAALYVYKDGALESVLDRKDQLDANAGTSYVQLGGSDLVFLETDEYIEIHVFQNSGGALALHGDSDYNYLAVHRV